MNEDLDFAAIASELKSATVQRYDIQFLGSPQDEPRTDPIGYTLTAENFVDTISWVESVALPNDDVNPQIRFLDLNPGSTLLGAPRTYELDPNDYVDLLMEATAAFARTHLQLK